MSKSRVPYEKKVEIARDYLEGRVGYKESIQRANNSAASFRRWVHLYQEKGAAGLLPNRRNRVYPADVKRNAVQETSLGRVVRNRSAKNMRSGQHANSVRG